MRRLLDMLRGTSLLRIYGARPERLLNLLARNGIRFAGAERTDDGSISFSVLRRDLSRVLRIARQAGLDAELLRHRGLPSRSKRLRSRFALFLVPPACMLAAFVLSLFIWEIEITGNESISDAQILSVLADNGITTGTLTLGIDRELLRDRVIDALPKISWMTVNTSGCRAEVIVRERVEPPEIPDPDVPADIIASRTGLICELSVFDGLAQAEKGKTVLQGELLISGTMPSIAGNTRLVRAQGIAQARCWYEISEKMPLEYLSKSYTGASEKKKSLIIGNYRLNLYLNGGISLDSCDKIIYKERLSLPGGMLLPIATVTAEYREYAAAQARLSEEEAEAILRLRLLRRLKEQTQGEPSSLEFEASSDGEYITVTLRAECIEDIGQTVPMQTR